MTYQSDTPRDEGPANAGYGRRGWGAPRRAGSWRPLEIAAAVLGFMVYWPVGLAIVGFKVWQRKAGYQGDMASAVRDGWSYAETRGSDFSRSFSWGCGNRSAERSPFRGFGGGSTGNTAFDDWRKAELSRLEEEHRKLEAAEREFSDFLANLRQAKDREEFDRFMNQRHNSGPTTQA